MHKRGIVACGLTVLLIVASLAFWPHFTPTKRAFSEVASTNGPAIGSSATDYTRAIRIAHTLNGGNASNGAIIEVSDTNSWQSTDVGDQGFALYQSNDNGSTWSSSPIATVNAGPGTWSCCVALMELPQQMGAFAAGTLLLAGTIDQGKTIAIWRSTDEGRTWIFHSDGATGGQGNIVGLWEPEFTIDSSGKLLLFFSDERYQSAGYSQLIGHVASTDGGITWGNEVYDVAKADNSSRPGMARIIKLPTGTYMMAYEYGPDYYVRVRTSSDGDNWGDPTNAGTIPTTSDGSNFTSAPGLAWSPAGGVNGEAILVGKSLQNSPNGGAGSTFFVSTDFTTWHKLPAPLAFGVPANGDHCENYSTTILPSVSGTSMLEFATSLDGTNTCRVHVGNANAGTLPYASTFASGMDAGWTTYGGTWGVSNGEYRDTAYSGQGDKALTGVDTWGDYSLSGDVELTASGTDAGFIVHVTNANVGADALNGYVIGLGSNDGMLYLGREQNGWSTLATAPVSGGVAINTWYHLTIQAVGCTLTVTAQRIDATTQATLTYVDNGCSLTTGQIGLRTHSGTASWRNLFVTPGGTTNLAGAVYSAPFAGGSAPSWVTYGGSWAVTNGTYADTAYSGQGDKAVLGTPTWGNQTLTGDVSLTSGGTDAGFIVRVNNPGTGGDALTGYVIGLGTNDGNLYLGREQSGWSTLATAPLTGGVATDTWYHLTIQATGCNLTLTAQRVDLPDQAVITTTDCAISAGAIGLRTHNGTAAWQDITVLPR